MSQSESKPVFYLELSNPLTGNMLVETYHTLMELLYEMDKVKDFHPSIKMCATVTPASKQAWLDEILTRDNLK